MLPVLGLWQMTFPAEQRGTDYFLSFLADELGVPEDILDFELTVSAGGAKYIGLADDFIKSRLDKM